ncbi:hypothetical protein M4D52_25615 [Paenibacillus lactis]|uniref:hypothetical protein n=1 Tax=Paenibacillus lactis TaxID=228574 RepID=UPI00203C9983|nr:hypothetical protein [Paenibacillus lactis]MCM3496829.1 hypothetical protein [Paenibacillus lactis]
MKFAIHYSTRMKDILIFSLVISIIMFQVATLTEYSYPVLFYMQMAVNAVMLVALAIEGYARLIKREIRIQENSDTITINGALVKAEQIREIKVSGCHKAAFHLSLKDKNVTPLFCSFKFEDKNCEGIRQLTKWAERNGIAVRKIGPQTRSDMVLTSSNA